MMLCVVGVKAQPIVNADFSSLDGWTPVASEGFHNEGNGLIGTFKVHSLFAAATVDNKHLATDYCIGMEARWQGNYSSFTQETAALPAGDYTLQFDVENVNTATKKASYENRFTVTVGETVTTDTYTEWMDGGSSWTTHSIKFSVAETAKATISLGYGTGSNNFAQEVTPVLYISNLKLMNATEADEAAVAANTELVAGATVDNPIYAPFIVNGTFDSNIDGWSRTGAFQNNKLANNQQGDFTGNFYENWNGVALANKMYQVVENIPNGVYKLYIAAFVNTLAENNTCQNVFANNDKKYLTTGEPTMYEIYTRVQNNQLEVGLEQTEAVANWMGIDNVTLYYYGENCTTAEAANADQGKEPLFTYQKYVVQNVASKMCWGAGNDWGTRASLVKHPEYLKLVPQKDGTYFIESQVNNGNNTYYFNGDYMDGGSPIKLIVKRLPEPLGTRGDGTTVYGYTISNGRSYYGYDGSSTILGKNLEADSENAVWVILSLADAKAVLSDATEDEPMDATILIEDHDFGRNNRYADRWTMEADNQNMSGGNNINNCAESFHSPFTLSQKLADAPKGVYALTAQGFYRQDKDANETEVTEDVPVFYANGETMAFPVMTGTENNMSAASVSFTNGLYTIDPIFVEVTENGELTIGAKGTASFQWVIFDNFVLTYYGPDASLLRIKNAALVKDMEEWVEKVNAISANVPVQAVKDLIEAAVAKANSAATIDDLNEAIDLLKAAYEKAEASIAAAPALAGMENVMNSTNVYTAEAYATYKGIYDTWKAKYEAGELTKADVIENPETTLGWHAENQVDDLLMSAWDAEPMAWDDYYINTWSTEGEGDGTNFKVPFFEYFVPSGETLAQKTLTATLNNMEDGVYTVTAWVRIRVKDGVEAPAKGITLLVNDGEAVDVTAGEKVGNTRFYLKEFTATGIVKKTGVLKIQFNVAEDNNISWLSFKNVKYTSVPLPEPVPVVVPEDLVAEDYALVAKDAEDKDVTGSVMIGFKDNDVYFQGFSTLLPQTWVKGTLSEDGKTVTVDPDQFMGKENDTKELYFNYEGEAVAFAYNAETGVLSTEQVIKINNDEEQFGYYANTVLTNKAIAAEMAAKAAAEAKVVELKAAVEPLAISEEAKAYEAENVKTAVATAEQAIADANTAISAVEALIAEGKLATDNAEALATAIAAAEEAIETAKTAIATAETTYVEQKAADEEAAAKTAAETKLAALKTAAEALVISAEAKAYEAENVQTAVATAEQAIADANTAIAAVEALIAEGKLATENKEALATAIADAESKIADAQTAIATAEQTYLDQLLIDDAEAAEAAAKTAAETKLAELKTTAEALAISEEAKAYEAENVQTAVATAEQAIADANTAIAAVETVIAEGKLATDNKEALATAIATAEQAIADAQTAIQLAEEAYVMQKAADEAAAAEAAAKEAADAKVVDLKTAAEALAISEEAKAYEAENVQAKVATAEQAIADANTAIATVEAVIAEGKLATDNKEALATAIATAEQAIAAAQTAIATAEQTYVFQKAADEAAAALAAAKEALQDAIIAAKAVDTEGMTDESVQALVDAIAAAEAALADENATVESLNAAKADLEAAVAGLEEKTLVPVTPPADMALEDYTFSAIYRSSSGSAAEERVVKVGFDGDDVYVSGLSYYLENDSWVKGKLNADKTAVTFASPQMYGTFMEQYDLYFIINNYVSDEDDTYPTTYEVGFDAETGNFTFPSSCYLLEGSEPVNAFECYGYYYDISLTKGLPENPEPVVVPEDLVAEEYTMTALDAEGQPVNRPLMVGFKDGDVYFQGFGYYLPEAWVKGTLSADGTTVTLEPKQYLGTYYDMYDMFLNYNGSPMVFAYDAEAGNFSTEDVMRIDNAQYFFEEYKNVVITKVVEVAAMPANPSIMQIVNGEYGSYVLFDVPTVDVEGNGLLASKLSYQFFVEDSVGVNNWEVKELVFTTDLYTRLTEDMTVIPYGFTENYDFYSDAVYLNMPIDSWYRIGIKSIYTGGGETHETEIQWLTLKEKEIIDGINDIFADKNAIIYNMSGQKLDKARKGLHIINGRKVVVKNKR